MWRFLKWAALAAGVVLLLLAGAASYVALSPLPHYSTVKVDFPVEVTPERVARGKRTAEMLCAG